MELIEEITEIKTFHYNFVRVTVDSLQTGGFD